MCVAILAIFFTFKNVPANEIFTSFKKIEYLYLFPTALIVLVSYVVRVYRWHLLVTPIKTVPISLLFPPMMIGLLGNLLPMRAGEIFRAYLLNKKTNIPFTKCLATIMVERMFDVLMLNILFTWVLVFYSDRFGSGTIWLGLAPKDIAYSFGFLSGITLFVLLIAIYLITYRTKVLLSLIEKLGAPFPSILTDKFNHWVEAFAQGLSSIGDKKVLIKVGFYSLLDWILLIFAAYPLYLAFDLNHKTIESMLVLAVTVPVFMTLLPTPSFIGSVQAGVFVALHKIMGEDAAVAAAYGMVGWAWSLIIQVMLGLYFLFREHISWRTLLKIGKESVTIKKP